MADDRLATLPNAEDPLASVSGEGEMRRLDNACRFKRAINRGLMHECLPGMNHNQGCEIDAGS